jgi:RHS repeat-associated protein
LLHGGWSYGYDPNGNLTSSSYAVDPTKNKSITYNLLNLPLVATVPTGTVTYTYDATGNKLRKVDVLSGVTKTTDYINGIEYDNSTTAIGFIQNEEGKAVPNGTGFDYVYYLGDNLGNTRVTFGTKTGVAVVYQQDDYYPFGLEINRTPYLPKNEYLYNRKELQEETQSYDFGARGYDPLIARWLQIDPLAEFDKRWSPYNYVVDNPIRLIDLDGMEEGDAQDQIDKQKKDFMNQSDIDVSASRAAAGAANGADVSRGDDSSEPGNDTPTTGASTPATNSGTASGVLNSPSGNDSEDDQQPKKKSFTAKSLHSPNGQYFGDVIADIIHNMKNGETISSDELLKINPDFKTITRAVSSIERTSDGIKLTLTGFGKTMMWTKSVKNLNGADLQVTFINGKVKKITSSTATIKDKPLVLYLGHRMVTDQAGYTKNGSDSWWYIEDK